MTTLPSDCPQPATAAVARPLPRPTVQADEVEDHRTRTAARRRETMRRRLLESAMLVFAEKGVDASVIDDVISTAGVSRGTFYKYFKSNRDLMVAANEELGKELLTQVLDRVAGLSDPAERLALGGAAVHRDRTRLSAVRPISPVRPGWPTSGRIRCCWTICPITSATAPIRAASARCRCRSRLI